MPVPATTAVAAGRRRTWCKNLIITEKGTAGSVHRGPLRSLTIELSGLKFS